MPKHRFDQIIAPVDVETFFSRFWEQRHLYIARNDANFSNALGGEREFLSIAALCREWGDVSLAKANVNAKECDYLKSPPDIVNITQAFAEDYTVVINDYDQKCANVAALAREFESVFCCRCNINAYLTGSQARGLNAHYDDDDVFVIQLSGTKIWRIFRRESELPTANLKYKHVDVAELEYETVELSPGDVLYIPRGIVHDARAGEQNSLHLTVSINVVRWHFVLKAMLDHVIEKNIAFRRSVPMAMLREVQRENAFLELRKFFATTLMEEEIFAGAVGSLQDELLNSFRRMKITTLAEAISFADVEDCSLVRIAEDQICFTQKLDSILIVKVIGVTLEFPHQWLPLAELMISRKAFCARDLATLGLAEKSCLKLIRNLIDRNVLEVVRS